MFNIGRKTLEWIFPQIGIRNAHIGATPQLRLTEIVGNMTDDRHLADNFDNTTNDSIIWRNIMSLRLKTNGKCWQHDKRKCHLAENVRWTDRRQYHFIEKCWYPDK